jgi:GntR family transcriptional regulator
MELRIDPSSAVPVYAQVVEQVRTLIALRALRPGDKLPSVRELAAQVRINRNTAAKAYQLLEAAGVLETRAGQGTFVADGVPPWSRDERLRRLEASIGRALIEAYHLGIPFDEVLEITERLARAYEQGKPARAGGGAR